MKKIEFTDGLQFPVVGVLKEVIEGIGQRGIALDEMRKRIRVLDAVESMDGNELQLEDADYECLRQIYNSFQFGRTHRDLVTIGKNIDEAKSPTDG